MEAIFADNYIYGWTESIVQIDAILINANTCEAILQELEYKGKKAK